MKKWIIILIVLALLGGGVFYIIDDTHITRRLSFMHEDHFDALPISDQDKANIQALLTPLADWSMFKLAFNQSEVEARGDKIRSIPFMRFIAYIFSDPQMKQMMTTIRGRSSIWRRFGSNLVRSLGDNYQNGQMMKVLPGFAEEVGKSEEDLMRYIDARDWRGFLNFLFT